MKNYLLLCSLKVNGRELMVYKLLFIDGWLEK